MNNNNQNVIKKDNKENAMIDARIISFSPCNFSDVKSGSCFSYFGVSAVPCKESNGYHELQNAYEKTIIEKMKSSDKNLTQFLLAFTDIIGDNDVKPGYTQNQITDFWKNSRSALLFLTMVNLRSFEHIEKCIEQIKSVFNDSNYRIYFTFDHCDLVIFCRMNNFKEYGELLEKLSVKLDLIAGLFTLYQLNSSLINRKKFADSDEEKFNVLIRAKIDGPQQANELWDSIRSLHIEAEKQTFFDHYRYGLYCPNATLKRLSEIMRIVKGLQCEILVSFDGAKDKNIPDFDKSKQIELSNNTVNDSSNFMNSGLEISGIIKSKYDEFSYKYTAAFKKLRLEPDMVWLRWLKNSSQLAATLMENPDSQNIGACLVPQYLDLFDYGIRFFGKFPEQDSIDKMLESMSVFFSDIAILVDSMNQSDRQFIQIPSYHLPSFEVPPKIMEYYIAVAHKLMHLFREDNDKDTIYSLLITPQFINYLGVKSIADQRVLEDDQWLEIVIGESSFYTLQLTTQTLGHEISHFVGQKTRCREVRKECALKFAYCLLIFEVWKRIPQVLTELPVILNEGYPNKVLAEITSKQMIDTAEKMYNEAKLLNGEYVSSQNNRMVNLKGYAYMLAYEVSDFPSLYQIFRNVLIDPNNIDEENTDFFRRQMIEVAFDELIHSILGEYVIAYSTEEFSIVNDYVAFFDFKSRYISALDYFKETFADLQAIMVFNMDWMQYCRLISRQKRAPEDCYLRMLAVAKVLVKHKFWNRIAGGAKYDKNFSYIEKAIELSPINDLEPLHKLNFNALLLYYLVDYLESCYLEINKELTSERCKNIRSELQSIHDILGKGSALDVQKEISSFVQKYRKELENDPQFTRFNGKTEIL